MTNHTITMEETGNDRWSWECSCGTGGSTTWAVETASDRHIDYEAGDSRTDRYPAR